jgi:DNA-binding GntR family transcriptional regulator
MAAGMLIALMLIQPKILAQVPERLPPEQAAEIDGALRRLDEAVDKKDWEAMKGRASLLAAAVKSAEEQVRRKETKAQLRAAHESLAEVAASAEKKDVEKVKAALAKFLAAYGPIARASVNPDE